MSIWSDIHKRSNGEISTKEDYSLIYYPATGMGMEIVGSGEYDGNKYEIFTNGTFPMIKIYMDFNISAFSGCQEVKLNRDDSKGKYYTLDREIIGKNTVFTYYCDTVTDYTYGDDSGDKYTLDDLKVLAEKFIDLINACESDMINHQD